LVGGERHLAQEMAGDEDGPALGGEAAEQFAHPPDALRVQPVHWLVAQDHRRIAQQRRGQAQPLTHPQ
jgi:hypothetical protein